MMDIDIAEEVNAHVVPGLFIISINLLALYHECPRDITVLTFSQTQSSKKL